MAKHTVVAETRSCFSSQTNCHNCGAPITGSQCEYCGTVFRVASSAEKQSEHEPLNDLRDAHLACIEALKEYNRNQRAFRQDVEAYSRSRKTKTET